MSQSNCSVENCGKPSRKRGWCESHYSRWRRNGSTEDSAQNWVWGIFENCLTCGQGIPSGSEFRRYCSRSCAVMFSRPPRATVVPCVTCGAVIDLLERGNLGRRKYRNATSCVGCRAPHLQPYVADIVARDGLRCGICGIDVDLSLTYPDPLSKSVDHVVPRSKRGPDDLANFQLSHLRCNVLKNNREGFTLRQ